MNDSNQAGEHTGQNTPLGYAVAGPPHLEHVRGNGRSNSSAGSAVGLL